MFFEEEMELVERQLKHNVNILKRFDNDLAARKVVEEFDKMIERRKVEDGQVFKAKSHQLHDWVKQQAIIFAHRKTENEDALKKTDQFLKKIKNGSEPPAASDIKRERSGSCSGTDPARTEVQSDKKERAESEQRSSSGSDAARTLRCGKKEDPVFQKTWWQKFVDSFGGRMFRQREDSQFLQVLD